MNVICSFKTELDLNNYQKTACLRYAGAARYAYNWGLMRKIAVRKAGEKVPTAIDLHRELNTLKQTELSEDDRGLSGASFELPELNYLRDMA